MVLRLVISLYTTRIVLRELGEDDYGIYILVAGFSLMFSFVNASMSTSVSRFISYSIGKGGDESNLKRIFSSALTIQCIIAVAVIALGSVIGIVFIRNVLSIPVDKIDAASVLFICTLFGLGFQVIQVPYNAAIISYERMSAYAYIEIVNTILLLVIVYMLELKLGEPLIVYGLLLLGVSFITFMTYVIYCRRFPICKFRLCADKAIIKPMLSFSGADLFSNSSLSAQAQGQNIVFNKFYSLTTNAAIGIANQVYGAMLMFSSSITTAIRPQIIKSYASGDKSRALSLIIVSSKILCAALICIGVPIIIRIKYILSFWLGTYPDQAPMFVSIILIMNMMFGYKGIIVILLHATGKIGRFSVINGLCFFIAIPLQYLMASFGISDNLNYCTVILLAAINIVLVFFYIGQYLSIPYIPILVKCSVPAIISVILCLMVSKYINNFYPETVIHSILYGISSCVVSFIICWIVELDNASRAQIKKLWQMMIAKIIR